MKPVFLLPILVTTLFAASLPLPAADIHLAQGLLAGEASTFKTLPAADQSAPVQFVLTSCLNHAFFQHGDKNSPPAKPEDRALGYKKDNHANLKGFQHEARAFFEWLKQSGIDSNKFFILCGDRHWKYHSRHPHGFSEFSCGALNLENSRLGRAPGDPKSNDPDAKIRQPYTDTPASGGFLHAHLTPAAPDSPATLAFTLHDDTGKILYRHQSP